MGMYKRVELMSINGLLDMPIVNLIYIYKITCVHNGVFYIGQTSSVKDRVYSHIVALVKMMQKEEGKPLHFHSNVYPIIMDRYNEIVKKKLSIEKFVRDSLSVYVIALVADQEAANLVESHYIAINRKNKLCLNKKG